MKSLQFYLGPAGAGKSYQCLSEMVAALRKNVSPAESPLVLLLPEQATAEVESDLLRWPGVRASMRARVLSFKQLARWVLNDAGVKTGVFLDDVGRIMLMRAILNGLEGDLLAFGSAAKRAGFIEQLVHAFTELSQYRHSVEDLEVELARLVSLGKERTLLARKLHDLILVGRAWRESLDAGFSDSEHYLDVLAGLIGRHGVCDNAEIWVDGFASFLPQEMRVLEALLKKGRAMRVALLVDPVRLGELPGEGSRVDPMRLFSQTEETWLRLRALALDNGVEVLPDVVLPAEGQEVRFDGAPALALLERGLRVQGLVSTSRLAPPWDGEESGVTGLPERMAPVLFVEAAHPREEVEAMARGIRRLCREEGYRYRDIAVAPRSLDGLEAVIRQVFTEYGIPYFIDRRRDLGHHPLTSLIRSACRAVLNRWPLDDVVEYLKTDFAPVDRRTVDRIENAARAYGVRGLEWWLRAWSECADGAVGASSLDGFRVEALAPLRCLDEALRSGGDLSGAAFVGALRDFLEVLDWERRLEGWADAAMDRADAGLAEEHEQALEGVGALLDEMEEALGEMVFPLEDLVQALETGLASITMGLTPPALDQVLVGTVDRSRQPAIRAMFVPGMNEDTFPAFIAEDVIFSDAERRELGRDEAVGKGGLDLSPPAATRLFRERFLAYVAMTRSSGHLWLSWSAADDDGGQRNPSIFLRSAWDLLRDGPGDARVFCRISRDWLDGDIGSAELGLNAVEGVLRAAASGGHGGSAWGLLGERLREMSGALGVWDKASASLRYGNAASIDGDAGSAELGRNLSVSQLETYAQCPFRYFCQYLLRLQERETFDIHPMDIGSFTHGIMERVFQALSAQLGGERFGEMPWLPDGPLDWGDVPLGDALRVLDGAIKKEEASFLQDPSSREKQVAFFVGRARRNLAGLLESLIAQGREDGFVQVAGELGFGFEKSALGPFRIVLSGAPTLSLHGKVDRLDLARMDSSSLVLRIVDYKSSQRSLDVTEVASGLSLQLPLYLLALRHASPKRLVAGGAFYVSLTRKMESVNEPPDPAFLAQQENRTAYLHGLVNAEALEYFGETDSVDRMRWVSVRFKKDGTVGWLGQGAYVPADCFDPFLEKAASQAARLGAGIAARDIAVRPYVLGKKCACDYCPYVDICRMDPRENGYRVIRSGKKIPELEAIREEMASSGAARPTLQPLEVCSDSRLDSSGGGL